jgi:hypothetical protein
MTEKSRVRTTVEALSGAGLVLRGRLFEADSTSVTIDADGVHYDVLLEYVTNAVEVAKAKRGDSVEVRVSPDAKVVEKRLIGPRLPGIITGGIFGPRPGGVFADDCDDCSVCTDCTECSYCVCECTECSVCLSRPWGGYRGGGFRGGFARRQRR